MKRAKLDTGKKNIYSDPGKKSGEKEGKDLMNICLYCGSQNFLPEDEDPWINSLFQQENTGHKPLTLLLASYILRLH